MDKNQILVFAAVSVVLAIRLYIKYKKKDKIKPGSETKSSAPTSFPSSSKDEDYEPYSKR
jgi:hypothetical protein